MPKKISELAKELNMPQDELITKLVGLGYDVDSAADQLTDKEAAAAKNSIEHGNKTEETKIVKSGVKKDSGKSASASKVQIKAADISVIEAQVKKSSQPAKKTETAAKAAAGTGMTPPVGKPMPKSSSAASAGRSVPMGRPMPKNAVPQKKAAVPQNIETAAEEKTAAAPVAEAAEVKTPEVQTAPVTKEAPKTEVKVEKSEPEKMPQLKIISKAEVKPETKAEVKEEVKAEEKPAEIEKTAPKAEVKEEKKAEEPKKEEPKAAPVVDYTPGIGVKIIRRAADEPKEEKKPVEKKPVEKKNNDRRDNRNGKPEGKKDGKSEQRKPKEYVGNKGGNKDENSDNNPRRKNDNGAKRGEKRDGKVVAYTAPAASANDKRRKDKDKDKKDRKDTRFDAMPTDLSKEKHGKHAKYKDKTEVVEVNPELENLEPGSYVINVPITVAGFCEQIEKTTSQAIMALMKMGIMANINQNLDEETAVLLGMELGVNVVINKAVEEETEEGIDKSEDRESELVPRPPVVTVMGHVDHGKTSLLDAIRNTNVTAGEAGGITQHIGASEVEINGQKIVFLDTPGHEAFTAMRARGAYVTDIAVLVVAADDGVMPQTIESISHAKAAGVPIIVAINKMDKPSANPDRVKTELSEHDILVEDWGGTTIAVPVSAKTGMGITNLLEMILLQAEMLELKANPNRLAQGNVIEARLDKTRGPVATLLVTNGSLSAGSSIVAGTAAGRIRVMTDWRGNPIRKVGPSRAVEITGLAEVPEAGDEFYAVSDDKTAREIAERRREKLRQEVLAKNSSMSLEKLFSQLEEGETKDLNLIIKADVQGSVGALEQSLEKLQNENVRVKVVHSGVGAINESDVTLAETSNAVIIGFNVRPSSAVQAAADAKDVEIRCYRIIYEIIDDIEAAMKGMLDPEFKEVIMGKIEVRTTFKVPNVGVIAGAYVTEGKVARNAQVRLLRDGVIIHEGVISSLKRFKDDAREVAAGFECGIGIEKYNDIKEGDVIEAFKMEEVKRD
ncbi:MAG: translation initiation factor IF-2 [Clostridia bacterium]|nr:translation initiation factor IF-2 [Clostridia bacterium]